MVMISSGLGKFPTKALKLCLLVEPASFITKVYLNVLEGCALRYYIMLVLRCYATFSCFVKDILKDNQRKP